MTIETSGPEPITPFDAIRREDQDGEWWSARELQRLLGYRYWQTFADAIERAKAACEVSGNEVTRNFRDAPKVSSPRGPGGEDHRLSRYACYLIAMNGDPRKPEIAAAQTYFAVKTREAEMAQRTGTPVQAPTDSLEVLRAVVDQMITVRDTAVRAEMVATEAVEDARLANARLDAIEGAHDWMTALAWAKWTGKVSTDEGTLKRLGTLAGTIGRSQKLSARKVQHERYGSTNSWPINVWELAYEKWANS